jgi:hypothetical protein
MLGYRSAYSRLITGFFYLIMTFNNKVANVSLKMVYKILHTRVKKRIFQERDKQIIRIAELSALPDSKYIYSGNHLLYSASVS